MFESAILIFIGIFVGIVSSFFGIGGGIIALPTLYALYPSLDAQTVIGTSLGMIFCNSIINVLNLIKNDLTPEKNFIFVCAASMIIGVLLSSRLAIGLTKEQLKLILAIFLLMVAIKTIFIESAHYTNDWSPKISLPAIISSFFSGVVAGITGLGGGALLIPFFITFLKMPRKWVPVYSNSLMIFGTGLGLLSYAFSTSSSLIFPRFQLGHINLALILFLFIGSFFGSKVGSHFIHKTSDKLSKWLFIALLLLISGKILLGLKY